MLKKRNYFIFFAVLIGLLIAFLPTTHSSLLLIILFGLLSGFCVVSFTQDNHEDYVFLLSLFICAFLSRIVLAFWFYHFVFLLNGKGLLSDAWPYSENGARILQIWLSGVRDMGYISEQVRSVSHSGTISNYDFWNAIVYFFTGGESPLSAVFINCLAGSLTVIFIFDITKQFSNNRKILTYAAILTAFWPSTFLWSIQNLKEPITVFFASFLMWIILRVRKNFRFYLLLLAAIPFLVLKQLREFVIPVFLCALLLNFFLTLKTRKETRLFLLLGVCLVIFLFIEKKGVSSFLPKAIDGEPFLEWLHRNRSYRASGGSAFLAGMDITNLANFIIFLPLSFLVAWLAPFPWQMGSLGQISGLFEMIVFYLLLPCMFYGIKFIIRNNAKQGLYIVLYIFIMGFILALIEGNIGTLFRHRAMILPFCFIPIAIGLEKYKFRITAHHEEN